MDVQNPNYTDTSGNLSKTTALTLKQRCLQIFNFLYLPRYTAPAVDPYADRNG